MGIRQRPAGDAAFGKIVLLAEPQDTPYVEGALILLFEDGIQVDTLRPVQSGYYQSSYHPKTGPAYHLEIYASGFEPVKTVPEYIPEALALHDLHLMEAPQCGRRTLVGSRGGRKARCT